MIRAISDYSKAIDINPKIISGYLNRGAAYLQKENYIMALFDFDKAIYIEPTNVKAYFAKGQACMKAGMFKEAKEAFSSFIEYAPLELQSQINESKEHIQLIDRLGL